MMRIITARRMHHLQQLITINTTLVIITIIFHISLLVKMVKMELESCLMLSVIQSVLVMLMVMII